MIRKNTIWRSGLDPDQVRTESGSSPEVTKMIRENTIWRSGLGSDRVRIESGSHQNEKEKYHLSIRTGSGPSPDRVRKSPKMIKKTTISRSGLGPDRVRIESGSHQIDKEKYHVASGADSRKLYVSGSI